MTICTECKEVLFGIVSKHASSSDMVDLEIGRAAAVSDTAIYPALAPVGRAFCMILGPAGAWVALDGGCQPP